MENDTREYAEQYTLREKIRLALWIAIASSIVIVVCKFYIIPWLKLFIKNSPCLEVFGINGFIVLMYVMFVGIPLSTGLLMTLIFGHESYRILRNGQAPPIGQKVTRPTKIKRGKKARFIAYLQLLPGCLFLALAIWGANQAKHYALLDRNEPIDYCKVFTKK